MTNYQKVREFMLAFGQEVLPRPSIPSEAIVSLREKLIDEEFKELQEGIRKNDIVEIADALTDILYVVYGAGCAFGLDLDRLFEEVHRSNMSKLGQNGKPIYRHDGKVMKGKNYFPPNIKGIIDATNES